MHRDIKPANVLINKNWNIKLCDFGFGRDDLSGMKTIKIGTPLYRDPNVVSGNYTKKCDIYSAGLVFDTIFRGKSLYEGVSP
jgi:serine/threonine protein kinase